MDGKYQSKISQRQEREADKESQISGPQAVRVIFRELGIATEGNYRVLGKKGLNSGVQYNIEEEQSELDHILEEFGF